MWNNGYGHWNMMNWDGGVWPWFMGFHGILWILFLALIVFALVHLIRGWRRDPGRDAALATLAQEYASGRIDRDEFMRRKKDLA